MKCIFVWSHLILDDLFKNVSYQCSGIRGCGRVHKPKKMGGDEFEDDDEVRP